MLKKSEKHGDLVSTQPYPYTYKVLASWYETKIRKVVDQSGLVDNALELLNIGRQNGINVSSPNYVVGRNVVRILILISF